MRILTVLVTLLFSQAWAKNKIVEIMTGVDATNPKVECDQLHNVKLACFKKDYSFLSCFPGKADENGTVSYIARCSTETTATSEFRGKSPDTKQCLELASTYMSELAVCQIDNTTWFKYSACLGEDQTQKREQKCKNGCDKMPTYHVCDWKQSEYDLFKNCSTLNNSIKNTRETLCPKGRPDVDETAGPPPRIHIDGNRYSTENSYLTFTPGFKISINSVIGGDAEFCVAKSGAKCEDRDYQKLTQGLNGGSKYILDDELLNFPDGTFTLSIKNSANKKITKMNITKLGLKNQNMARKKSKQLMDLSCHFQQGAGLWTEIQEVEYSPVLKPNENVSSKYVSNPVCDCIGEEQKDTYGRRWKCSANPEKYQAPVIAEANDTPEAIKAIELPGCSEQELKCNQNGFKYFVKKCWGGSDPNESLGSNDQKWYSYIYPEQYIQYTTEQCYGSTVTSTQ